MDRGYHNIPAFSSKSAGIIIILFSTGLMKVLHDWVRQQRTQLPLHLIRFMAHLALFLRTSEYNTKVRWVLPCKNVSSGICGQQGPRSAYASAQSDQGLHSANRLIRCYLMYEWRAKAWMILCVCAG